MQGKDSKLLWVHKRGLFELRTHALYLLKERNEKKKGSKTLEAHEGHLHAGKEDENSALFVVRGNLRNQGFDELVIDHRSLHYIEGFINPLWIP